MTEKKQLIAWLNDAYSMENSLAKVLDNHAKDSEDFPEIRARIAQHADESRRHAEIVERCLAILDEKPSAAKSMLGTAMGKMQGAATGMFRDELVKNFLSDYAAEHMEIASYTSLIAAADSLGYEEISTLCEEILSEEEEMADWLGENIPTVTQAYLTMQAARN